MLKLFIIFLIILISSTRSDFPISAGCKRTGSSCTSGTECCSGNCLYGNCIDPCKKVGESCDNSNHICCSGTQCRSSDQKCCHLGGKQSASASECCNDDKWKPNETSRGGRCCSEHAEPCKDDSDCCGTAKCSVKQPWTNICI